MQKSIILNMKVIIVEDEHAAAKNLISILQEIDINIEVLAVIESVKDLFKWLSKNNSPDLGFFDIQLSDNNVFDIFQKIKIEFPIIFTTAYSEYAINAFKVNSIDYILKPLNVDSVKFGINKYKELDNYSGSLSEEKLRKILVEFNKLNEKSYKKSFLVHYKDRLIPVETSTFAYFIIENGIVYGITSSNKKYIINHTLEEIEKLLDPYFFKRVNRQFIINRKSIVEIALFFNERYSLKILPSSSTKIIMSKAKSSEVRVWLES